MRNPYKHQNRILKAVRIVEAAQRWGETSESLAKFTYERQCDIAEKVGSGPPSPETWSMVIDLMGKRSSDPFRLRVWMLNIGNGPWQPRWS